VHAGFLKNRKISFCYQKQNKKTKTKQKRKLKKTKQNKKKGGERREKLA
jgi:hypothetical protein